MKEKKSKIKYWISGGILLLLFFVLLIKLDPFVPQLPPTGDLPPYELPEPTDENIPPKITPKTPNGTEIKKVPVIQVVNLPDTSIPPDEIIELPVVNKKNGGGSITPNFAIGVDDVQIFPTIGFPYNVDYSNTPLNQFNHCENGGTFSSPLYFGTYPDQTNQITNNISGAGTCFQTTWSWGIEIDASIDTNNHFGLGNIFSGNAFGTMATGDYWAYHLASNNTSFYNNLNWNGTTLTGDSEPVEDYVVFSQPTDGATNINITAQFTIHYQNTNPTRNRIGYILQSTLDAGVSNLCGFAVTEEDDNLVNCNVILQPTTTYTAHPVIYTDGHPIDDDLDFTLIGFPIEFTTTDELGTPIFGTTPTSCGFLDIFCYFQRIFGFIQSIITTTIDSFKNLPETLQAFFPFNLLADLTSIITTSFDNKTSSSIGDVEISLFGTPMTIFTMEGLETLMGTTAINLINSLINIVLYSAFAMMIYTSIIKLRFKS